MLVVESNDHPCCERFHAQIGSAYPNTNEGKLAPVRTIFLKDSLPAEYQPGAGVRVTPTFVLINNNKEIDRLVGYPGDEHFWFLPGEMLRKLPK